MEKATDSQLIRPETFEKSREAAAGIRFDWIMIALLSLFVSGVFMDGSVHRREDDLETFFTTWHAVLYAGFLVTAGFLYITVIRNQRAGFELRQAIPKGYEFAFLGSAIFLIGGVADMFWHTAFGIEDGTDALYSPTHLLLAVGGGMMGAGPLRSAWIRYSSDRQSWVQLLPMLLSLTYVMSLVTFFTMIANPVANLWGHGARPWEDGLLQDLGVNGTIVTAAIVSGTTLFAIRRWELLPGSLTILYSLNALMMGFLFDQGDYPLVPVIAMSATGLVADVMLHLLRPSATRPDAFRVFAFITTGIWAAFYFLAIQFEDGIWWSVHLWGGTVFLSALIGWLISFLVLPPRIPSEAVNEHPRRG